MYRDIGTIKRICSTCILYARNRICYLVNNKVLFRLRVIFRNRFYEVKRISMQLLFRKYIIQYLRDISARSSMHRPDIGRRDDLIPALCACTFGYTH